MGRRFDTLRSVLAAIGALAILLVSQTALAAQSQTIVDTAYVADALKRHAIVWDVRPAAAYKLGHIPGATNIDDIRTALRNENSEEYLPLPELERRLGAAGIDPSKEIIVYGAKASSIAYMGLVTLQYLGASNAKVFHGGFEDWKDARQPVTTVPTHLPPVTLKLSTRPDMLITTSELVRRLHDPSLQILDVRRPTEFSGEEIHALRGGHIPGAIPIYFMQNVVDPEAQKKLDSKQISSTDGLNLKSPDQLREVYAKLDPNKETIVYCQSGVRASETATILKTIGFSNVRVYKSSWLGYGNTLDAPAEDVTFLNIDLLQDKLRTLQQRVEGLEKAPSSAKRDY
ncbi:rhodanese-like domain-containing protein [Burkholderia contaminans]|uniref:sulfurtransferase n=1 Tax=Burkholderia contaminans TaxID=488447 RepID=UPI003110609C